MTTNLTEFATAIIVLGIVVSVGAVIMNQFAATQITSAPTYTVVAESITPTDAGVFSAKPWATALSVCTNGTASGRVITSTNYSYSINANHGKILLKNLTSEFTDAAWKCNYTVRNTSYEPYDVPDKAAIGLLEYGSWFKVLVIVAVAAVVLGLIFMAFGRKPGDLGNIRVGSFGSGDRGFSSSGGASEPVSY